MKIKKILFKLADYLSCVRGVGHTRAMLHGAINTDPVICVHTIQYGKEVLKQHFRKADFVSLHNLDRLIGLNRPLVFDNCALHMIFKQTIIEIERLESKIRKLEETRNG